MFNIQNTNLASNLKSKEPVYFRIYQPFAIRNFGWGLLHKGN